MAEPPLSSQNTAALTVLRMVMHDVKKCSTKAGRQKTARDMLRGAAIRAAATNSSDDAQAIFDLAELATKMTLDWLHAIAVAPPVPLVPFTAAEERVKAAAKEYVDTHSMTNAQRDTVLAAFLAGAWRHAEHAGSPNADAIGNLAAYARFGYDFLFDPFGEDVDAA